MEAPEHTCSAPSARDQPAPAPGLPGTPSGQASPHLTLGPVILPPEQGLPATVFLKALPIPLYHTVPPGGLQPRAPLGTGGLDGGSMPFILSPLLPPEGPGATQVGKPAARTLTVNIVGALPVLSPGLGPTLGSPGKVRNAGKYLCPHCGRDCLKPSVLEKHLRSHTGERPFPCATCGIAFKTQSNLYKHRRTQTHLNNSRVSLESEVGGSSLLEDGDRAGEPSTADPGEHRSQGALSPGAQPPLAAKNLELKPEAAPCPGSTRAPREAPADPGPLASPQPRRRPPQQEMTPERPWDARAAEGRLRKCESTDSGYLSRSDSAEQPPVPSSPLHSLSEHSAESEGEGGSGGPRTESGAPVASLELEKRRLEERIARLISHNQAVVDDPQLDHVRPRKTVLSKQGSLDLPMPYTYKDSFHFDIRAREPRRREAPSPARSACAPPDKSRPLFFHSVPTQLSTTVECVPVTRSNSMPFVEGSRTWLGQRDLQDACPRMQKPLSPRLAPARLGCRSGMTLVDVPSGHPRALVRQVAVEDLPCTPAADTAAPAENPGGKTAGPREGPVGQGRAASKKCRQRKLKMFSQEKWQVYGNETFKRMYQKMKTSHQGGQKAREARVGHGAELDCPPQEQAEERKDVALSQDSGTPVLGDTSVEARPGSRGSLPAPEGSLETEPPKQKTVTTAEGGDQPRVARTESSPTLGNREPPCLGSRSPPPPPNERLDLGCPLPPTPGPLQGGDLGAPRLVLMDPKREGGVPGSGGMKDICLQAQTVLRLPSGGSGEPWPSEHKLPSERKKLKVEGLGPQEQSASPGAESPGGPAQAASLPSERQDSDPRGRPGGPLGSAQQAARPLGSSGAAVMRQVGPGDKEATLPPATRVPKHHSELATQPQAPSVIAAQAEITCPPKYLLRLPQGATPSPLPGTWGPGQSHDCLRASGRPEEQASLDGSGLGTPWSPHPASGAAPGEADSVLQGPSCSRPRDGKEDAQVGRQKGDRSSAGVPAAGDFPSTGVPQEAASFLPTPVCDAPMAPHVGGENHALHHLCTGSTLVRTRASGGVLTPWACTWELGVPPEGAPQDSPPDPPAGLNTCCPFQPGSFLAALSRPQGMPPGWLELVLAPHLGMSRSGGAQSTFASLGAEPRLTWCCLSRSLPLPAEQEKATSAYLALHFPRGCPQDEGPNALPLSSGGWTRTSPGGRPAQAPKLSCPVVPGMRTQDRASDPERQKGPCRRRATMSHGNSKQRKWRLHPKRGEGSFWQSRAQLRASRLRKPPWVPRRSCAPPPLQGLEPPGTLRRASSEVAGPTLPVEIKSKAASAHSPATTSDYFPIAINIPYLPSSLPERNEASLCHHFQPYYFSSVGFINKNCNRIAGTNEPTLRQLLMSGRSLQGEPSCASAELSLGHGKEERQEDGCRQISEPSSPGASSRAVRETEESAVKAISPSAGERGDCCPQEDAADVPGSPLHTCLVVRDDPWPQGKDLDVDSLESQLQPSQDQVSTDPKPRISSDAQEPSSFGSKGTLPCHDIATSAAAICISLGERTGRAIPGIHGTEPQDHSWAAGETRVQSSPDRKAIAEGTLQTLLPGKASPGQRIWGLAPSESPGKTPLEIPASGPSSTSSHQEEGKHQTDFPSRCQYRGAEMAILCPTLGSDSGKCQASGLITPKGYVAPSNPGQSSEVLEAPSRSIRKRSLEGMRKQTRVELSDTSSDDEDRLVIEI